MFEFIIALLLASSCPSPKTVIGCPKLGKPTLTTVSISDNQGCFKPNITGCKYLPTLRILATVNDTAGDNGHIRPDIFGRKYLPFPHIIAAVKDTAGDNGHIRPDIFGRKRILKA